MLIFRSSRAQMFFKISVLKNFALFTGKHLCWPLQAFIYRAPRVAASGFSRQQIPLFSWIWNSLLTVVQVFAPNSFENTVKLELFCKKDILRNFGNFTEKHLCRSLFLIELLVFRHTVLSKIVSNTDVFLWNLQNF